MSLVLFHWGSRGTGARFNTFGLLDSLILRFALHKASAKSMTCTKKPLETQTLRAAHISASIRLIGSIEVRGYGQWLCLELLFVARANGFQKVRSQKESPGSAHWPLLKTALACVLVLLDKSL